MKADNEETKNYDGEYFGRDPNKPLKKRIMYICDQTKCGDSCSAKDGECIRTTDIYFAAHYMSEPPNKTLEKHFIKHEMILDEPTIVWEEKENG